MKTKLFFICGFFLLSALGCVSGQQKNQQGVEVKADSTGYIVRVGDEAPDFTVASTLKRMAAFCVLLCVLCFTLLAGAPDALAARGTRAAILINIHTALGVPIKPQLCGKGESQPPKNIKAVSAAIRIMKIYSAKKNSAKAKPEYTSRP